MGALGGAWLGTAMGERHRPSSAMQATLFSLLLLHRDRGVSLDTCLGALWPESTDHDLNRNRLRVHMSNLRRWTREIAGPDAAERVETRGEGYALVLDPGAYDVAAFELLVARGRKAILDSADDAARRHLEAAVLMWDDPYPELADVAEAEPERVRLHALHDLATDELAEVRLRAGAGAELIGTLQARLVEHPFRERIYDQLMRALYQAGRQAQALEVYQLARRTLRDELGLEPGPALRALEAQILDHSLGETGSTAASAVVDAPAGPRNAVLAAAAGPGIVGEASQVVASAGRFVGREHEVEQARASVAHGRTLIVAGEPGIGKTRLVQEVARLEPSRSWVWTRSARDPTTPPLWSVRHALEDTSVDAASAAASEFERNHRLIERLRERGPTVLVLDDFHWADSATVRFVRQLTDYAIDTLRLVLIVRDAPAELDTDAGRCVLTLSRHDGCNRIRLDSLDIRASRELAGPDTDESRLQNLHTRSGGNPLFLTELISAGEHGSSVPPVIANVVVDRLERVDPRALRVLAVAAVVGEEISPALVMHVGRLDASEVLAGIDVGRRTAVLATEERGTLRFAHALLRESLAGLLSAEEVCAIHDRVATELEEGFGSSADIEFRRAYHAVRSLPLGSAERAVDASMKAGAIAASEFAFADARDHYERARHAAEHLDPATRSELMPAILCELGYQTIRAGETPPGRALLLESLEATWEQGDDARFVRAARCLTEASSPAGTGDANVTRIVERAVELSAGQVTEDRVQLLVDLAGLRYFTHDLGHRRALCEQALELAPRIGDRAVAIACIGTWTALYEPGRAAERAEIVGRARGAARRSRSVDQSILAASLDITTCFELGQIQRGLGILHDASAPSRALQAPRLEWFLHGWRVVEAVVRDDLAMAEALADEGLSLWEDGAHQDSIAAYGGQLTMIRFLQGRGGEMVELIKGMRIGDPDNPAFAAALAFALSQDDPVESATVAHRLLDDVARGRLRDDALTTTTLAFLAETVHALGPTGSDLVTVDRVVPLVKRLEPLADMHTVVNAFGAGSLYWGSLHHAHGLALGVAGDVEGAEAALARAVAEHERVGAPRFAERSCTALERIRASTAF